MKSSYLAVKLEYTKRLTQYKGGKLTEKEKEKEK